VFRLEAIDRGDLLVDARRPRHRLRRAGDEQLADRVAPVFHLDVGRIGRPDRGHAAGEVAAVPEMVADRAGGPEQAADGGLAQPHRLAGGARGRDLACRLVADRQLRGAEALPASCTCLRDIAGSRRSAATLSSALRLSRAPRAGS
jgi:hypothetical protein